MTLSSLSAFSISLTFAALALVLGPGEARAEIKCGSTLGPRGAYVLNTDLVCPASADKHGPGILRVVGGATLDLNGHTVTCSNRGWGIRVDVATLTNGTVRGCSAGVVAGNAIVRNMTLIDNYGGVEMTGEQSSGANLIVGNIATGGNFGFFVEEAHDNTFLDNQAIGNASAGFYLGDSHGNTLSGNVTTGSGAGFKIYAEANLFGNRALKNVGAGFVAQGRGIQRVGNIAKKNGGPGFNLDYVAHASVNLNSAQANRGDGFSILVNECGALCWVQVLSNLSIGNGGIGFHVLPAGSVGPPATGGLSWNTAAGNNGGDMADDANCRSTSWTANTFGTKRQACIR